MDDSTPSSAEFGDLVEDYNKELKQQNRKVGRTLRGLFVAALCLYGLVGCVMFVSSLCSERSPLHYISYIILATLALTPLAWIARMQMRDKYKIWALREDAHTNQDLIMLLPFMVGDQKEGVLKLFDHFDKHPRARLVALDTDEAKGGKDRDAIVNFIQNAFAKAPPDKSS